MEEIPVDVSKEHKKTLAEMAPLNHLSLSDYTKKPSSKL